MFCLNNIYTHLLSKMQTKNILKKKKEKNETKWRKDFHIGRNKIKQSTCDIISLSSDFINFFFSLPQE